VPIKKSDLRIVFLGNPEFARFHLERIVTEGYNVVAVVSAPDRPSGRGMKLHATSVTAYAREQGIQCLQPTNLKSPVFLSELKSFQASVQVVIAFRMLPDVVWNMPSLGTINLHASLLPQYRGAAPINWAIINGETETGVSTFRLKHEIDTGNLLLQKNCIISNQDNAGTLHDKLMHLGATAIVETLDSLTSGNLTEIPQKNSTSLKNAPKLFMENTAIDWNAGGQDIINLIRGLSPYPLAHTQLDSKLLKVVEASFLPSSHKYAIGEFLLLGKKQLAVAISDGLILLLELKLEGKRQMKIGDFLNGYDLGHLNLLRV
jgi:methionyl-tRNA formyltransferase